MRIRHPQRPSLCKFVRLQLSTSLAHASLVSVFYVSRNSHTRWNAIMFTQDSRYWKHAQGHLPLRLDGLIRMLMAAKLRLSLRDIQSPISEMLMELSRREKEANIKLDPDVDVFHESSN
ncbi:hypothetical protein NMG60_11007128 [Bertholletia excelsa]